MAGIPPTVGFFGKFYIFTAAIQEDLYWLAFWGVLNSVIAVYYYLRPVVNMYMKEGTAIVLPRHYLTRVTIAAAAILVIVLGFGSGPIIHSMRQSFAGLF